ncbi:DUF6069 family protein [Cryobacterium sp. MLB-32]|uniref:DUF6069 family protein n=1 Tax=Cryobacterium sp. MLB-32 TaxID=1529318 RepID=UPI0012E02996|nr:DUF6069 family protein [Cryobacterium sp. MLB-32]
MANAIHGGPIQASTDGTNPSDAPYVGVIIASVLPIANGAALLWFLARFTTSALRLWTIVAIAVLVNPSPRPQFFRLTAALRLVANL